MELDPTQLSAAEHVGSPLLVTAGPGSGKTGVILGRIKFFLKSSIDPSEILCLTFSEKAAKDVRERLEDDPEIKENIVFVSSIYPGNTAEDIEKLITEPLEDKLKSVNNIIEIKSSSKENLSLIIIEFDDGIGYTEAKLKVKDEVKSAVASEDWPMFNNVKVDPNVFNMTFTEEMPIVNINISGDYSTEKLKEYSEICSRNAYFSRSPISFNSRRANWSRRR